MERTDNQLAHKLALQHGVLNAFELVEDGLKPHMGGDPFGGDPSAMAPVKRPSLLVKRVAARVYTISGRRMGSGPCKQREGAGAPVPQGVEAGAVAAVRRSDVCQEFGILGNSSRTEPLSMMASR
jgi:hypothetical protein